MRDIYVKTTDTLGVPAVRTSPAAPGLHSTGKLSGFSVCRILDVPETVSDALAVFTFNQCKVAGHTVKFGHLQRGQAVRGEGLSWDPADPGWGL